MSEVIPDATGTEPAAGEVPPGPRRFRYLDHLFEDPDPTVTIDAIRQALIGHFPELARATHHETTLADGTREIRFEKQITTMGTLGSGELARALAALPPYEDPLVAPLRAGILQAEMTLGELAVQAPALEALFAEAEQVRQAAATLAERCTRLAPHALPCVPLGF